MSIQIPKFIPGSTVREGDIVRCRVRDAVSLTTDVPLPATTHIVGVVIGGPPHLVKVRAISCSAALALVYSVAVTELTHATSFTFE